MQLRPKTATVFGATGFIGSQIVRALAKQGIRIKIPSRVPERAYDLKLCGHVGQIVPFACDFGDPDSLRAAVRGSDFVVNCVGILFQRSHLTFERLHHQLPRHIAEACAAENVERLVHISALGAGQGHSRYAASKGAGEQAVLQAFPRATILRPSVVFGPDDSFFNMFAGLARHVPVLPLIGGGHTKLQPVYVGDVAAAVEAALTTTQTGHDPRGRIYELGGPDVIDFRQLYALLARYTGRSRALLPLPWWIAKMEGMILGLLPRPLLTMDQVENLKTDNIVAPGALSLADLGVEATEMALILPDYLDKFRTGGRFGLTTNPA